MIPIIRLNKDNKKDKYLIKSIFNNKSNLLDCDN